MKPFLAIKTINSKMKNKNIIALKIIADKQGLTVEK